MERECLYPDSRSGPETSSLQRWAVGFGCVAVMLGQSACMTKTAGNEMRRALDERIARVEADAQLRDKTLEQRLVELTEGLERTRSLLTRDSADVGAAVQTQQMKMSEIEGKLDELAHGLGEITEQSARTRADLDDKLGKLGGGKAAGETTVEAVQFPADKAAHYSAAYDAYKAGDQDKARALFKEYVVRYPSDPKAGDAQYWVGATYLVQNKPATALGEYRKVIQLYPKSPAFDTALYGMADAFFRLHACTDAKGALEALTKRKPSKALDDRVKQLTRAIKESPKGYCTS
jgi:TolA-binding protein